MSTWAVLPLTAIVVCVLTLLLKVAETCIYSLELMGQSSSRPEVSDGYILTVAAKEGHADVVDMYCKKNAALALHITKQGNTTVQAACEGGHANILHILLATLQVSAASNTFDPLQRLLDHKNLVGMTALAIAAWHGHVDCVQFLLSLGCSLWILDNEGRTCLHHAALHGHATVVELLLRAAERRQHSHSHDGIQDGHVELLRFVNQPDAVGRSALHHAGYSSDLETIHSLVKAGASLTAATTAENLESEPPVNQGATPLHLAAIKGDKPAAVLLLTAHLAAAAGALPELTQPCCCDGSQTSMPSGVMHAGPAACSRCQAGGAANLQDPRTVTDVYGLTPYAFAASKGQDGLKQLLDSCIPISELLATLSTSSDMQASRTTPSAAQRSSSSARQAAHRQLKKALINANKYLAEQRIQRESVKQQHEQQRSQHNQQGREQQQHHLQQQQQQQQLCEHARLSNGSQEWQHFIGKHAGQQQHDIQSAGAAFEANYCLDSIQQHTGTLGLHNSDGTQSSTQHRLPSMTGLGPAERAMWEAELAALAEIGDT